MARKTAEQKARIAKDRLLNDLPLTTGQAALLAGVDPKTVANWVRWNKIEANRSPGGHWMIPASEMRKVVLGEAA